MEHNFLGIVVFLMVCLIFLNETYNVSKFLFMYNTIKNIASTNMNYCNNGIYIESETERFQLSKSSYDLLLKNDIYNCKTYIYFILIYSILFYIYTFNMLVVFLYKHKIFGKELFLGLTVIFIVISIILRYVPNESAGYENTFKKYKYYYLNPVFVMSLILFLFVLIPFYFKTIQNKDSFKKCLFLSFNFLFAFYFMFNIINIVFAFRNNNIIYDDKPEMIFTADISYNSENYFYYRYKSIKDHINTFLISAFTYTNKIIDNRADTNYSYDVGVSYASNLKIYTFLFLLVVSVFLISFVVNFYFLKNPIDMSNYFYPYIYLFILFLFICNNAELNTSINYNILFEKNLIYKNDLLDLNKKTDPFIKIWENKKGNERNYLNNYIIFNVLQSYLYNYINIFTNESNFIENREESSKITSIKGLIKYAKETTTFEELKDIQLKNEEEFKTYYNKIFSVIDGKDKAFYEKFVQNIFGDFFINVNITPEKRNEIKNNIKKNIYALIEQFKQDDIKSNDKLYLKSEIPNKVISYKFIITNPISYDKALPVDTDLDDILDKFLIHIEYLYSMKETMKKNPNISIDIIKHPFDIMKSTTLHRTTEGKEINFVSENNLDTEPRKITLHLMYFSILTYVDIFKTENYINDMIRKNYYKQNDEYIRNINNQDFTYTPILDNTAKNEKNKENIKYLSDYIFVTTNLTNIMLIFILYKMM